MYVVYHVESMRVFFTVHTWRSTLAESWLKSGLSVCGQRRGPTNDTAGRLCVTLDGLAKFQARPISRSAVSYPFLFLSTQPFPPLAPTSEQSAARSKLREALLQHHTTPGTPSRQSRSVPTKICTARKQQARPRTPPSYGMYVEGVQAGCDPPQRFPKRTPAAQYTFTPTTRTTAAAEILHTGSRDNTQQS